MSWTDISSNFLLCNSIRNAPCSSCRVRRIRGSRTSQSEIGTGQGCWRGPLRQNKRKRKTTLDVFMIYNICCLTISCCQTHINHHEYASSPRLESSSDLHQPRADTG